jgi:ADP-ribosyl-[dinitrogen reductase] hydrolase
MPDFADRARGAVIGQFIGDAMALGSHWHYNLLERERLYPDGIQGFERPSPGHYHSGREPGDPTHYGDAARLLLESLVLDAGFDERRFGRRFVAAFGAGYPGYRDKPTRLTIENALPHLDGPEFAFQSGADDFQTVSMCRLTPVVVLYGDRPDRDGVVERAVRVTQANEEAVVHCQTFARILNAALDGTDLGTAIVAGCEAQTGGGAEVVRIRLGDALAMRDKSVVDATGLVGRSCYLPCTFPSILHACLRHQDNFTSAVLETVRAGGDNASRAACVGALLGAAVGASAIPGCLVDRLNDLTSIEALIDQLLSSRNKLRAESGS